MLSITRILFFFLGLTQYAVDGFVVGERNADARVSTIHHFPNNTWVENIAIRSNGKILVTLINKSQVWQIDPTTYSVELVHEFDRAIGALGIAEYDSDVFAVNVGNFSDTTGLATIGSWSTWRLDFNSHRKHSGLASVKKIVDIPSAEFLNGMTAVPTAPGILLTADSGKGLVYRIDTSNKSWSVFLDDPTLKPNLTAPVKLGINGLHVHQDQLYFDNTFQQPLLARVPYHPESATRSGPVEVIFKAATFPLNEGRGQADDFSFDSEGNIWLASASSSVVKLDIRKETQKLIAGGPDDPTLIGTTSTAFGRTKKDKDVLYITTNGGLSDSSVVGIIGGKVLALNTKGL